MFAKRLFFLGIIVFLSNDVLGKLSDEPKEECIDVLTINDILGMAEQYKEDLVDMGLSSEQIEEARNDYRGVFAVSVELLKNDCDCHDDEDAQLLRRQKYAHKSSRIEDYTSVEELDFTTDLQLLCIAAHQYFLKKNGFIENILDLDTECEYENDDIEETVLNQIEEFFCLMDKIRVVMVCEMYVKIYQKDINKASN